MPSDNTNITITENSATLWVQINSVTKKAEFSTEQAGPYSPPPIYWNPLSANKDSLVITFKLGTGVTGMATKTDQITLQVEATVTMPTGTTGPVDDSFLIIKANGSLKDPELEDPKIVVTPQ